MPKDKFDSIIKDLKEVIKQETQKEHKQHIKMLKTKYPDKDTGIRNQIMDMNFRKTGGLDRARSVQAFEEFKKDWRKQHPIKSRYLELKQKLKKK